jgi:hypothetical protein
MHARVWPPPEGIDSESTLEMWTIYDRPLDYPSHVVVRRWFVVRGNSEPVPDVVPRLAGSIAEARGLVPPHRYRLGRQDGDDPFVVETWL